MKFLQSFLQNHVLANLVFILVIVVGWSAYVLMPRAKDPEINFNWITIMTFYPGAAATDIERRVTNPLEQAIERSISDIKFVSSTSRDGVSNILIRFEQIDERTYDKRLADVQREVQNTYTDELPEEIERPPRVVEISTSNGFPTATVVISAQGNDENLRRQSRDIRKDLEGIDGVDKIINHFGTSEPELHVAFDQQQLAGLGVSPSDIADTVRAYFRDVAAGDIDTETTQWGIRIEGTADDPERIAAFPILTANGVVPLGDIARIFRAREEPSQIVRFHGEPAALLLITKTEDANILQLMDRLQAYISERNELSDKTGVLIHLIDDQTESTRRALRLMQTNAAIGLCLVLIVTWIFLGSRIAFLTSIGIPFTLGGTFLILSNAEFTLNNTVLLGVVISLGMLVDDAVVVVESIYERLRRGMDSLQATIEALREVFPPVTTSVMTTIAVFLPLTLIPGIMGEFLRVIPLVVSLALAISLLEAYWILPAHVLASSLRLDKPGALQRRRNAFTHWVRLRYSRALLVALRHPLISVLALVVVFALAGAGVASGKVKFNFFEADPFRLFYVTLEAPQATSLEQTSDYLQVIEAKTREVVRDIELRDTVAFSGLRLTQTEPLFGDNVGQILVTLKPEHSSQRGVFEIADAVEAAVTTLEIPGEVSLLRIKDGPPTERPISIKVRGPDFEQLLKATQLVREIMQSVEGVIDITSDYQAGKPELLLRHDAESVKRSGVNPLVASRSLMAIVDGEIVTTYQDEGEEIRVRVLADRNRTASIDEILESTVAVPGGGNIALGEVFDAEYTRSQRNIRHYDFRRTITLEADINEAVTDTVRANAEILSAWAEQAGRFPGVNLDQSGQLDDIVESLDALFKLFLVGLGVVYIILGTQFRSYFQPFMIIASVPLALIGVILGLIVSNNPMSLYTMYGVVALAGIAVNSAIVLISAANDRLDQGMSLLHATVYAARRRVIPIMITSLTTIAGLASLAFGLGGKSLVWGPVATAIVWGLAFSSLLTLFVVPMLYRTFMVYSYRTEAHRGSD